MKLNILTIDGVKEVEVIDKPFSIKEIVGYFFFIWKSKSLDVSRGNITEYESGMCINNFITNKKELIRFIKKIGFGEFDETVIEKIKEYGVINK